MVSVCMFHQLSSPASARACLVPRNIRITIENLTSLGGSSAGFLIQALSRPAQKGCRTSFNGFQSQLFLMLRGGCCPTSFLVAQVSRGENRFFFPPKPFTQPAIWSHVPQPSSALGARSRGSQRSELDLWIQGFICPTRKDKKSPNTTETRVCRHIVSYSHSHKDADCQHLKVFPGSSMFGFLNMFF